MIRNRSSTKVGYELGAMAGPSGWYWVGSRTEPSLLRVGQREGYRNCISRSWIRLDRGRRFGPLGFLLLPLLLLHTQSPFLSASSPLLPCSHTASNTERHKHILLSNFSVLLITKLGSVLTLSSFNTGSVSCYVKFYGFSFLFCSPKVTTNLQTPSLDSD